MIDRYKALYCEQFDRYRKLEFSKAMVDDAPIEIQMWLDVDDFADAVSRMNMPASDVKMVEKLKKWSTVCIETEQ